MNRSTRNPSALPQLAVFVCNGVTCSAEELAGLTGPDRRLLDALSYALLSCRDHIRYEGGSLYISLFRSAEGLRWDISNWDLLSPTLRHAISTAVASAPELQPSFLHNTAA